MEGSMSVQDYMSASKIGKRAYHACVNKGRYPYLPVLENIVDESDIEAEVSLGIDQIPLRLVVGTCNAGRTNAFADNFMPILDWGTEFSAKWASLSDSQKNEGIRDPIKVYEYMNKFYVLEGNKRVSVLKYFKAVTVNAEVIRKVPKYSEDPDVKIYYEFMEFYKCTKLNDIYFSNVGSFPTLMKLVGITDAEKRIKNYPHQLSGGMRQRIVIAIALACDPELLICDEPTTALDVTIQSKILELIQEIQKKRQLSVIYITHDLGVVAKVADYVNVMYAGKIVESGTVEDVFYDPRHPYTWGLLSAMPDLGTDDERLYTIPGSPPNLLHKVTGDAFAPRNKYALNIDSRLEPPMFKISETHSAATWLLHPKAPKVDMPSELRDRIERMKKEGGIV